MKIGIDLSTLADQAVEQVKRELPTRAIQAAHILKNNSQEVLGHVGGGRSYKKPAGGTYTASLPGQPPAMRTGTLMRSWRPFVHGQYNPVLEGGTFYAGYLEDGTSKMAARPFVDKIVEMSEPEITAIYSIPFKLSFR